MCHNSYFDKAHKAVVAVFAPACVYMIDPVSAGVCRVMQSAQAMFISKYRRKACWTAWWENGITAICSSAACWVPSLWFCSYMPPSAAHMLSATLLCKVVWPSKTAARKKWWWFAFHFGFIHWEWDLWLLNTDWNVEWKTRAQFCTWWLCFDFLSAEKVFEFSGGGGDQKQI